MIVSGFRIVTLVLLAMIAGRVAAQPGGGSPHIAGRLVAETMTPAAGRTVTLAFVMTPQAGWHGYWKNPGDAGVETRVDWTLPRGVTASGLRYPVPQTLIVSGLMNYVYEGRYTELVDVAVPAGVAKGTRLPLSARLDWLACTREICVPEHGTMAIVLTVGDGTIAAADAAAFGRYRAALPRPLESRATYTRAGGRFRMAVPLPADTAVAAPYFFPLSEGIVDHAAPQTVTRRGDAVIVETAAKGPPPRQVAGVLRIGRDIGLLVTAVPGVVPAGGTAIADIGSGAGGGAGDRSEPWGPALLLAFGGAVLGGLLLNVMPCVFPILSLKALSLARGGRDEASVRHEALAYAAGVVVVCLALGAVLLALRAGGSAAGWAFQLQEPRVILVLLLLTAGIAFNLAGLFELPMIAGGSALAARGGAGGAFWTGALAAFIATPCTGPFMGAALGAALVLPAAGALLVFAGLGLGMAVPFLLLGFVPAARAMLPKPGAWMDRMRRILALPMFVTALGLAWILGRQAGVDGMTLGLAAAMLLGLGLWWIGKRQSGGGSAVWWPLVPIAAAAIALIAIVPRTSADARTADASAGDAAAGEEPFGRARLAALQAAHRPVFLYFTADWCLTCKVNERVAIRSDEVHAAFAKAGVVTMVGDWTRGDAEITRYLAEQGRSGVPLYMYAPAGGAFRQLPQVLTPAMLVALTR